MNKLIIWYHNSPHFRRFFEVFVSCIAVDSTIQMFMQNPDFAKATLSSVGIALLSSAIRALRISFFLPKD